MSSIYILIQKTLATGYLSIETENQLHCLYDSCCDCADLDDLVTLKQAIAFGHVKRQATEVKRHPTSAKKPAFQAI
jgi:hypothetical protein